MLAITYVHSWKKYKAKSKNKGRKTGRKKKTIFISTFALIFDHHSQKFISRGKAGHSIVYRSNFEILLILPNFYYFLMLVLLSKHYEQDCR